VPAGWIFLCSAAIALQEHTRTPSSLDTLKVPGHGSWIVGFGFCVWSFFVQDAQVRTQVALMEHVVHVA
jgi:hypothetical protein